MPNHDEAKELAEIVKDLDRLWFRAQNLAENSHGRALWHLAETIFSARAIAKLLNREL